jgi:hypothetical protein
LKKRLQPPTRHGRGLTKHPGSEGLVPTFRLTGRNQPVARRVIRLRFCCRVDVPGVLSLPAVIRATAVPAAFARGVFGRTPPHSTQLIARGTLNLCMQKTGSSRARKHSSSTCKDAWRSCRLSLRLVLIGVRGSGFAIGQSTILCESRIPSSESRLRAGATP